MRVSYCQNSLYNYQQNFKKGKGLNYGQLGADIGSVGSTKSQIRDLESKIRYYGQQYMQKLKPNASFKEVAEAGEQAFKSPAGFVQTYGRDDLKELSDKILLCHEYLDKLNRDLCFANIEIKSHDAARAEILRARTSGVVDIDPIEYYTKADEKANREILHELIFNLES